MRDWSRCVSYPAICFALSISIPGKFGVGVDTSLDILLSGLLLATAWALLGFVAGVASTLISKGPSRFGAPWWTMGQAHSAYAVAALCGALMLRVALPGTIFSLIGVVAVYLMVTKRSV